VVKKIFFTTLLDSHGIDQTAKKMDFINRGSIVKRKKIQQNGLFQHPVS
jgi:hypothetical protein